MVAGLWHTGTGTVVAAIGGTTCCFCRGTLSALGNLRSQLLYPNLERDVSDEELLQWLVRVSLPALAQRFGGLNAEVDWAKSALGGRAATPGVCAGPAGKPRYLLLDEATSALDADNEERLYSQLEGLSITPSASATTALC